MFFVGRPKINLYPQNLLRKSQVRGSTNKYKITTAEKLYSAISFSGAFACEILFAYKTGPR